MGKKVIDTSNVYAVSQSVFDTLESVVPGEYTLSRCGNAVYIDCDDGSVYRMTIEKARYADHRPKNLLKTS